MTATSTVSTSPEPARLRSWQAAAEQPDVLARLRAQGLKRLRCLLGHDGHVRIVVLPQRPRKDKRLHAGQGALPRARHALEGPASDEDRVELFEQGAEVDVGIH